MCADNIEALVVVLLLLSLSSGVRLATVTDIFFFVFSSPHFSLTTFSINSLQLLLSFAVVLHSPPTLSRCLSTQSSHYILGLPRLLFPTTSWASALFVNFSSPHVRLISAYSSIVYSQNFTSCQTQVKLGKKNAAIKLIVSHQIEYCYHPKIHTDRTLKSLWWINREIMWMALWISGIFYVTGYIGCFRSNLGDFRGKL